MSDDFIRIAVTEAISVLEGAVLTPFEVAKLRAVVGKCEDLLGTVAEPLNHRQLIVRLQEKANKLQEYGNADLGGKRVCKVLWCGLSKYGWRAHLEDVQGNKFWVPMDDCTPTQDPIGIEQDNLGDDDLDDWAWSK